MRVVWSVLARHRCRRLSLARSTPCRSRARCVVCYSTSSVSSLVKDGFDTLPRLMCGLLFHFIAAIACYCRVSGPVATTIVVRDVHTDNPGIVLAIGRGVVSVLARHRYRRLSLTVRHPAALNAWS